MSSERSHWSRWHDDYDDPESSLSWRLQVVQQRLREALDRARREGKLVLVNFTGYACTNCHWMKANMFTRPEIAGALKNLVLVELYTDGEDAAVLVVLAEDRRLHAGGLLELRDLVRGRGDHVGMSAAGFVDIDIVHRDPLSIDDCALYPLFSSDVIDLMRRLIPPDRHSRVAVAIVVRARLP